MGTLQFSQSVLLSGSLSDYININTLFCAVVVLAILFLIMCITYFINIKPNLNDNTSGKGSYNNSSVDKAITQIVNNEEEELVSDCELVAVITAAIYASMGDAVPADGFVVRSIRRANSSKWKNA
ncbi:MAG TPA: OadG family protein [Mobilitalea sp.]|nr:OadG family protein [Mobilitalea sp.]